MVNGAVFKTLDILYIVLYYYSYYNKMRFLVNSPLFKEKRVNEPFTLTIERRIPW
jgi:hypothetical protein